MAKDKVSKTRSELSELCPGGSIARLICTWDANVSLEIINQKTTPIYGLDSLKKLRDELDKFIYITEAMEIDTGASEGHIRDLYGNNMSINYALKHGLLERR